MSFRELILSRLDVPEEGTLNLAFSGGSDSLALLSLLPRERVRCVYIDHNIRNREELEKEIGLNRRNASFFGVPLDIITIPEDFIQNTAKKNRSGIEAAARQVRYEALEKNTEGWILTAHHLDDQAETVIMRLLSGSPVYKLSGINPRSGRILRPMLRVPKEWIRGLLEEEGLKWSSDSTNSDTDYRRNSIRANIIPHLSIEEKTLLADIADNVRELEKKSKAIAVEYGRYCSFSRSEFLENTEMRREEVFFSINKAEKCPDRLSRAEIKRIEEAIEKRTVYKGPRFSVHTKKDIVSVYPSVPDFVYEALPGLSTGWFTLHLTDAPADEKTLRFDMAKVIGKLIIRTSREMDEILLKDSVKSVRELEKDMKVPYSLILEDQAGIVAVLARHLGGRDRLARRFLGTSGKCVFIT